MGESALDTNLLSRLPPEWWRGQVADGRRETVHVMLVELESRGPSLIGLCPLDSKGDSQISY